MHKLYKPNGKEIEVSDSSLKAALDLGWTKKSPTKKVVKKPSKKAE